MSVTICHGPTMKTVRDEPNGEPRWCFRCRGVREFRFIVRMPTEISYYGPDADIRCGSCQGSDADLFPGRCREWE